MTADAGDELVGRFEAARPQLRAVGYRMLGSLAEAEDAVQEAWVRLQRSDTRGVENLAAWLTTVMGRICLDMLRARGSRREDPLEVHMPDPLLQLHTEDDGPEGQAVRIDDVGLALLVLLDTLGPAERLAYVLHDLFDVPFEQIALLAGTSTVNARQLASRARRRVRESAVVPDVDLPRQRKVVDAFLAAARGGDFAALLEVLHPEVVLLADMGPGVPGKRLLGVDAVAGSAATYQRAATGNRPVLVNGLPGIVSARDGRVVSVLAFTVVAGRIVEIDILADVERLAALVPPLPARFAGPPDP